MGMIAWGKSESESRVTAEFYNCAIEVMRGAEAIDHYRGLPERYPVAAGGRIGDWIGGTFAAISGLAASSLYLGYFRCDGTDAENAAEADEEGASPAPGPEVPPGARRFMERPCRAHSADGILRLRVGIPFDNAGVDAGCA